MKIYLAARYSRHPEMRLIRDELITLGHVVTSRWIEGNHSVETESQENALNLETRARFAIEDFNDLIAADLQINFTEPPDTTATRGGRHVEYGAGLVLGQDIIVVGYRENVFHCLPDITFYPTWLEALTHIKEIY